MVLVASQCLCSKKGDIAGTVSSQVASNGSLTGRMSMSGGFACRHLHHSPTCAAELFEDPLTEAAAAAFEESAMKMGAKMT